MFSDSIYPKLYDDLVALFIVYRPISNVITGGGGGGKGTLATSCPDFKPRNHSGSELKLSS